MNQSHIPNQPAHYPAILAKCEELGFSMPSDIYIGTFLQTLIASKPGGNVLELGTGIGLSLCWMIEGLSADTSLISIDNDPQLTKVAQGFFGTDERVELICEDGSDWIKRNKEASFDLIFADAWPGKYSELEETLAMVKVGGFYVIDDMNPQPNWPDGHAEKAEALITYLESRDDFSLTKMDWSTGVIMMCRQS